MRVRKLEAAEVTLFRELRLAALGDSPDSFGETLEQAQASDWAQRLRTIFESADRTVLVAEVEREARGLVFVFPDGADASIARIGGMWVAPSHRRRGLGQALLAAGVENARDFGMKRAALWVAAQDGAALALSERAGFKGNGRRGLLRPGAEIEIRELVLELG